MTPYYEACKWDYCSCPLSGVKRSECACDSIAVFVKACNQFGKAAAIKAWRDDVTCRKYTTYLYSEIVKLW